MVDITSVKSVERLPVAVGAGTFLVAGITGFLVTGDRIAFIPAAFLGGFLGGVTSSEHKHASMNGIVALAIGFILVMLASSGMRIAEDHAADPMGIGDMVFSAAAVFAIESILTVIFVFITGYAGIYLAEWGIKRFNRDESDEVWDFTGLGK